MKYRCFFTKRQALTNSWGLGTFLIFGMLRKQKSLRAKRGFCRFWNQSATAQMSFRSAGTWYSIDSIFASFNSGKLFGFYQFEKNKTRPAVLLSLWNSFNFFRLHLISWERNRPFFLRNRAWSAYNYKNVSTQLCCHVGLSLLFLKTLGNARVWNWLNADWKMEGPLCHFVQGPSSLRHFDVRLDRKIDRTNNGRVTALMTRWCFRQC